MKVMLRHIVAPLGYYQTISGNPNQVTHLWGYDIWATWNAGARPPTRTRNGQITSMRRTTFMKAMKRRFCVGAPWRPLINKLEMEDRTMITYDVIVVGGGPGGMAAAGAVAEAGAKVALVETLSWLGGNARLSTGVLVFVDTSLQRRHSVTEIFANESAQCFEDLLELGA